MKKLLKIKGWKEKERFESVLPATRRNSCLGRVRVVRSRYSFSPPISSSLIRPPGALGFDSPCRITCAKRVQISASEPKKKEKERFESASPTTRVACRELSPALARLCSLALWLLRFAKTILNRFCSLALAGYPARFKSLLRSQRKNRIDQMVYPVFWRRRRDLNSRAGYIRPTPLAGAPLRPT